MSKIKVGITIGDMNGIGLEVIIKALVNPLMLNQCTPIIYGSSKVVSYHKNVTGVEAFQFQNLKSAQRPYMDKINVVNCWQDDVNIALGKMSSEGGKFAKISLEQAINDLENGFIDVLVTAPIHKKAMSQAGFDFPGHTDYLTEKFGNESLMFMVNDDMRVGLVTDHVPIKEVASTITKELIHKKLRIMNESLIKDFGIERPTIAVFGLNPHAGDDGVIGEEDENIIRPALVEAKKKGILCFGPFSADGFFGSSQFKKFDGILAMYHDQGLIPFKALSFGNGVNFTAGLNKVRTSPDHGTGFDIAGENKANHHSMQRAIYAACDIFKSRRDHVEMNANKLIPKDKQVERR